MSSVRVVKLTYLALSGVTMDSEWSMANATCDEFTPGQLDISRTSDGEVVYSFLPGQWKSASVLDDQGYEAFSFENTALINPSADRKSA
jgi:hypothetical protein